MSSKKTQKNGISVFRRGDRNGRVCVQWHVEIDGKIKVKTQSFETMADARAFADELRRKVKTHGQKTLELDPEKYRRYLEFEKKINGADLQQVADVFREWQQKQSAWKLSDAVKRYLELRLATGKNEASHGHVKKRLSSFLDFFGDVHLHKITGDEIQRFLASLRQSGEHGVWSIDNHIKTLRAFFKRAIREEWIKTNPTEKIDRPHVEIDEVSVLPVADAEKLFASVADNPIAPRLALEAFGGLRNASAERLAFEDINFEDKIILLRAKKHKSGKRYPLEKLPENLWTWLEKWRYDERPWKMNQKQCMHAKSKAFVAAGVPHPKNVLRHSFCSYYIARTRNAAETAFVMQHTSAKTTYAHYVGMATAADAEKYFGIVPGK